MSQALIFLKRFIQSPQTIGSIAPSSPALVNAMLMNIHWDDVGTIAELGAGTGVITSQIDHLRSLESQFLCFESDSDMHASLYKNFPDITLERDAFCLRESLKNQNLSGVDCVISGLPLVNFTQEERHQLLSEIHDLLNPGGVFVAFQYTRQLQAFLISTYNQIERQYIWANIPPAFVFVCRK
ncbi:class I SAM-dependent methyltransferase [Chromohalobacter nigrandesensis]|uniref:class I SAM-dependent methyltransferase n=1 Tax=Chromohalobacter nigrandesensis TaxID=119863 RepID=UPI001FF62246|nr:methyltransferase domain-containing protein [Chromohalobacter nigrandesensis]MCK0745583.1 methyltransferase domain-containing protein [Chromohalobacter nigrandesensis]